MHISCPGNDREILGNQKLLLRAVLFVAILVHSSMMFAQTISGRVSLPMGDVAPAGGLQIFYQARDLQASNPEPFQSTFSMILAGASFVDFTLSVPDNATAQWEVRSTCSWSISTGCRNYVQSGYYFDNAGTPATSYKQADAETVSQNSVGINMTVLEGTEFSGSMTMPSGTAPADFEYNIFVSTPDTNTFSEDARFTIPMGANTGNFRVTAPNDAALDFNIRYQCQPGFCDDSYVLNGYFDSSEPDNTTELSPSADDLPGDVAVTNIDMTFLTGATINGTISLPSGTATDDISVDILANDVSNGNLPARASVLFTSGDAAKNYTINAANDDLADWQISYFCNSLLTPTGCSNFFDQAFYDADDTVDGTTDDILEADTLAGGEDHISINLTLLLAASISGTVSLDAGLLAPPGGLDISLAANAGGGLAEFDNVHIAAGTNSINYTILIPDDPANFFNISFSCRLPNSNDPCPDHTPLGFFDSDAPGTTTLDASEAEELNGASSYTNINLTLFTLDNDGFIVIPLPNKSAVVIPSG